MSLQLVVLVMVVGNAEHCPTFQRVKRGVGPCDNLPSRPQQLVHLLEAVAKLRGAHPRLYGRRPGGQVQLVSQWLWCNGSSLLQPKDLGCARYTLSIVCTDCSIDNLPDLSDYDLP